MCVETACLVTGIVFGRRIVTAARHSICQYFLTFAACLLSTPLVTASVRANGNFGGWRRFRAHGVTGFE
jgi:hypothetical protein